MRGAPSARHARSRGCVRARDFLVDARSRRAECCVNFKRGEEGLTLILVRVLARPLGHLTFVFALLALTGAAKLLGEKNQLGVICGRLAQSIWRYPDVTRPGIRLAWLLWALLLAVTISPLGPLATPWDAVALAALGLSVLWRRFFAARRD